ncbi:MAG: TonB-dependent receptor [Bacteroidota bacterium]
MASGDTVTGKKQLDEVVVEAFGSRVQWKAAPAAVAVIGTKEIARYANVSLVPVFNTVPGIRMEERSPGSYRLSVRGSLLRSPFGIRNVKVYWNEIPLTDGGGNTYLNLININDISHAEIIKGPAASVYGAGTGGAVLLRSALSFSDSAEDHFSTGVSVGSYGLFQEQAGWVYTTKQFSSSIQQSHQQSDGYRDQSATRKDVLKWQSNWQLKKQQFHFLVFYTDLYYQTPGGITLAQMQQNPQLARQAAGALPSAAQQQAAIYNKTIFGAAQQEINLDEHFVWKNFVSANHTTFTNPFITNYENRGEANYGAGTSLRYQKKNTHAFFQWTNGAEWLYNHSLISDFGNRSGKADTIQFKDDIYAVQWFAYSQAQLTLNDEWVISGGVSLNNQQYKYKRLTDANPLSVQKKISLVVTPRISVLYRINKEVSLYMLAAKGFSPPALAELRPSDGNYYGNLNAEYGWNYEAGVKGNAWDDRLRFDVAAYFFRLQNAIVRRTNANGAEYFVNAGETKQNGVEALLSYQLIRNKQQSIQSLTVWSSYSYQPYRFTDYQQSGNNYSGNKLTGVPANIWVTGMDIETKKGIYLNASVNAVSSLALTDANDAFADAYQLVQMKLGYHNERAGRSWDVFGGVDNLLNQRYSLGNDINAVGKRYYNPAAGINVLAGMIYHF